MTDAETREILRLFDVGFDVVRQAMRPDAEGFHKAAAGAQAAAIEAVLGMPGMTFANLSYEDRRVLIRVLDEDRGAEPSE